MSAATLDLSITLLDMLISNVRTHLQLIVWSHSCCMHPALWTASEHTKPIMSVS